MAKAIKWVGGGLAVAFGIQWHRTAPAAYAAQIQQYEAWRAQEDPWIEYDNNMRLIAEDDEHFDDLEKRRTAYLQRKAKAKLTKP